ncbi:MAG: transposase [Candidatus Hydrogenedentes bacterium]|nr:transposase [Candidatus Hydrogenedentota bacterium]
MPRASIYLQEGHTYHLTHRCHNRDHHLRFARDRDAYRKWLREGVKRHRVPVYAYCVTSNHVHIVAHADSAESVSMLMHLTAGATGKQYNLRKCHEASVWEHPFQCTAIEDGRHLFNCLAYVDLNMVRAGVVKHPRDWPWCGYDELSGTRLRYRVLAQDRLLESLGLDNLAQFREQYIEAIERRVATGQLAREAHWSESLAVGSQDFVSRAQSRYANRMTFNISQVPGGPAAGTWTIREAVSSYKPISPGENSR